MIELLKSGLTTSFILATKESMEKLPELGEEGVELVEGDRKEVEDLSALENPEGILAVARIPDEAEAPLFSERCPALYFEGLKDPGNLGTILRTADHFGIPKVYLSKDSVDPYNPKVVRSSMGSAFRVRAQKVELSGLVEEAKGQGRPCIATRADAPSLYAHPLPSDALLLFGSEAHGLSEGALAFCDEGRSIPSLGHAESLNVAVSTGIFCSELMRGSG